MDFVKFLLTVCLFYLITPAQSQVSRIHAQKPNNLEIDKLVKDQGISPESTVNLLTNWNNYPTSLIAGHSYIIYFDDPYFGNVPMRIFIPKTYDTKKKTPLILLLHGAVQLSSFARAESGSTNSKEKEMEDDIFFNYFSRQDYIILRPFADPAKNFNWVYKSFRNKDINRTFDCIVNSIIQLKHQFNIDDSRIYAFGHSDGSDGSFCLGIYKPSIFAGFVCYNSMLTNIGATDIFLKNTRNRPFYVVHSEMDDIRPVQQTRKIMEVLQDSIGHNISYKEYKGYKHFDKHLTLDLPNADNFLRKTIRNPYQSVIYWEAQNNLNKECDWIIVDKFDLSLPKANWNSDFRINTYNKRDKRWENYSYYSSNEASYAIKARYNANTFYIETSRVTEFEVLISDKMIDLAKQVKIIANGRLVFNGIIKADKNFIVKRFETTFDRAAVWINSVKIKLKG